MQNSPKGEIIEDGFIGFLGREFGAVKSPARKETLAEAKKEQAEALLKDMPRIAFEPGKLQKVLDIFIEEESHNKNRIIDDILVDSWQKATEIEKQKIVASFIRKQKKKKNDWNDISELLNRNLESGTNFLLDTNVWKINLVTACLFVFVLSGLIMRVFPETANRIASLGDNLIGKPLYALVYPDDMVPKNYLKSKVTVSSEDLQNYIREHNASLPSGNNVAVNIGIEDIKSRGQVAGVKVSSDGNPLPEAVAGANVDPKKGIGEFILKLAQRLAEKQIGISEEMNKKAKDLLKQ